ncbi:MAG: RNA polymerase sigma factor [Deltaproteobacteria bacterium]|nr:MAG: RNA polymerase sigma factor [Deltaproteobacteria bacterium]
MMRPPTPPESELLRRAVAGEREARAALLEAHGPVVWGLCRRLCAEPEDAYQEIWEKLFRRLGQFDPQGSATLRTWVARVAHHHLIDRERTRRRRGEVAPVEELPPVESGECRVGFRLELVRVEEALTRLVPEQQRVVLAHCVHGVPMKDIAADEGVALGTVKARLHRARAELFRLVRRSP